MIGLAIGTSVLTIDIIKHRGSSHRVVQTGVENAFVGGVIGLNGNLSQLFVPGGLCLSHYGIEVPVGQFLLQILTRIVNAHTRNAHLYHEGLSCGFKGKHTQRVTFFGAMGDGL